MKYQVDPCCVFRKHIKRAQLALAVSHLKDGTHFSLTGIKAELFCELLKPRSFPELLRFARTKAGKRKDLKNDVQAFLLECRHLNLLREVRG